jgi:hypothetical protein
MSETSQSTSLKIAGGARYLIVALFGVIVFGGLTGEKGTRAEAGICAAPRYLCFNVNIDRKFYLVDTEAKRMLVYSIKNNDVRLVGVRKMDADLNIVDANNIKGVKGVQSTNGWTSDEAEKYLSDIKKIPEVIKAADPKYK